MVRWIFGRITPLVWIALLLAGCGQGGGSVAGEVTYDGQPVENGAITFLPADGKGPAAGGEIRNGRYAVSDVPPGPKIVEVAAVKAVAFPRTSEERARQAEAEKARGGRSGGESADLIPANAEGNHRKVEIKAGKQTLDLHLTKPGGTPAR